MGWEGLLCHLCKSGGLHLCEHGRIPMVAYSREEGGGVLRVVRPNVYSFDTPASAFAITSLTLSKPVGMQTCKTNDEDLKLSASHPRILVVPAFLNGY